jgi:hypothetical protein
MASHIRGRRRVPPPDPTYRGLAALLTPQAVFFRSYERLFRWNGRRMQEDDITVLTLALATS